MVLNAGALSVENGMVSDDAFGPFVMGLLLAAATFFLQLRAAVRGIAANVAVQVVLAVAVTVAGIIGAVLAIAEPATFNAGYGCLGRRPDIWLAAAMRPTPATCGYLIPASDDSLFYPAAYAAFGAAALAIAGAVLIIAGRVRRAT